MADEMSTLLSLFANYTNFYSVLSVLICFCVMVVFILRLNGENLMSSSATHYNVVKEKKMVSLHNPFVVQLDGQKTSALKDKVYLDITVSNNSHVYIVWGVNIQAFQKELQAPTADVLSHYQDSQAFDGQFLHWSHSINIPGSQGTESVVLEVPVSVNEDSLGPPPRLRYPLIVVTALAENKLRTEDSSIMMQYTVFHLKDTLCPLDSHIVYQFVKTSQSSVLSLQPIFVSSSEGNTSDETQPFSQAQTLNETVGQCNCNGGNQQSNPSGAFNSTCSCDKPYCSVVNKREDTDVDQGSTLLSEDSFEQREANSPSSTNVCPDIDGLEVNSCIVCQCAEIFYTLLPCRHACVCNSCIKQLDRCPMCRGYIDSFFRLQDVDHGPEDLPEELPTPEGLFTGGWEGFNVRLNQIFGFQEN